MDADVLPQDLSAEWSIVQRLGEGGQAETYLLQHRDEEGCRAALKLPKLTKDGEKQRFGREIRILDAIDHPNVVKLISHSVTDSWYVTPYGDPLHRYWPSWKQGKSTDEIFERARQFVAELLDGLMAFHAAGGVHRDIKPENVIVIDGRPILIDFGIAFVPDEPRHTRTDDRPVPNVPSPGEAFYGRVESPAPAFDCLQIAWLWAWMLMAHKKPKYARYHWRYHRFMEHPAIELVRAVVASCSVPEIGPASAEAMTRLLRGLGLIKVEDNEMRDGHDPWEDDLFTEAIESHASATAQRALERASRLEKGQAAAQILAPIYEEMRAQLGRLAEAFRAKGLPVVINSYNTGRVSPSKPALEIFEHAAAHDERPCLFSITCGAERRKQFHIYLACSYKANLPGLPFLVTLSLRHSIEDFPPYDEKYIHGEDGTAFPNMGMNQQTSPTIQEHVRAWLSDREHWRHT